MNGKRGYSGLAREDYGERKYVKSERYMKGLNHYDKQLNNFQ